MKTILSRSIPTMRPTKGFTLVTGFALATLFVATAILVPAAQADVKVSYSSGLRFDSDDGRASIKMGGRIHQDWAFLTGDDDLDASLGNLENGTEFRRVRLFASGVIDEVIEFKTQLDWADGTASFKDVFMGLTQLPGLGVGLRVGHFKQPFSLEELTSSNYISFLERAQTNAWVPSRESGFMFYDSVANDRATWAASIFRPSNSQGKATDDGVWNAAGRVTGQVWQAENDRDMVHLGVGATFRKNSDKVLELELAPEVHLHPDFNSGEVGAKSWTTWGLEALGIFGPASVQGEFMQLSTSALDGQADASFTSFYAMASVFVTKGDRRRYKASSATLDRVKPKTSYGHKGGTGAVELVARVAGTNLNDGDMRGGELNTITLGGNWYLNSMARVMLNYVLADGDTEAGNGKSHTVETRFQMSF